MKLTASDCIRVGFCISGQKTFCLQHGIDFRDFIRNGIEVDDLSHIDDANLARAILAAKHRETGDVHGQ